MKIAIFSFIMLSVLSLKSQSTDDFIRTELSNVDSIQAYQPQSFVLPIGSIIDLITQMIKPKAEDEYKPVLQMKAEEMRIELFESINKKLKKGLITQLQYDFENGALMGINVKDAKAMREFYIKK